MKCTLFSVISTVFFLLAAPRPTAADPGRRVLSYQFQTDEILRYKLTANIQGTFPIADGAAPSNLHAVITLIYQARPRLLLADGSADVDFKVESAEVEVENIPLPLPTDQVQSILNQSVTFSKTGEVLQVHEGAPLPFHMSIPGVDPKRLYVLLFPVVFKDQPVKPGDSWQYKSELLGGEGAKPTFKATILPPDPASPEQETCTRIGHKFHMAINQTLNAEKKPVTNGTAPHRWRRGHIHGSGTFQFNPMRGVFTQGNVHITAEITDKLVGKPRTPDEPRKLVSKVDAKLMVELLPAAAMPTETSSPETAKESSKEATSNP
jgi:hypothetical protein